MTKKFSSSATFSLVILILFVLLLTEVSAQDFDRSAPQLPTFSNMTTLNFDAKFAAPTFTAPMRIKANNADMKVDTYTSVPCVVDWDGDGKKDLLVGCFYFGNIYLYLNSGTNSSPVFITGTKLKADGVDISVAYG